MTLSKNTAKADGSKNIKAQKDLLSPVFAFFIPCAALLLAMILGRVAPFGENTLITDANAEWFADLQKMYESVMNGGSLLYDYSAGFGGSFYTKFVSGLCSPFVVVSLFFGSGRLVEAYTFITLLRAGFAGLFAWLVLDKTAVGNRYLTLAASCGYALCGFTLCSMYYPSVADAVVFFPLLFFGIYKYANESRLIFLFFYGAVFFLTSPSMIVSGVILSIICYAAFYFRRGKSKLRVYRLAIFVSMLLCSAAVSAVLVIPTAVTSLHYGNPVLMPVETININELLPSIFFGGYGTVSESGMYFMQMCVFTVFGVGAYMFNKRICIPEKLCVALGLLTVLVSAVVRPVGMVMFGFCGIGGASANIGFAAAWLAAYCLARNFSEADGIGIPSMVSAAVFFAIPAVAAFVLNGGEVIAIIAEIGFCVVFTALFFKVCIDRTSPSFKTSCIIACFTALCGTVHSVAILGSLDSFGAEKTNSVYSSRAEMTANISSLESQNDRSMGYYRIAGSDSNGNGFLDVNYGSSEELNELASRLGIKAEDSAGGANNFTLLTQMIFGVGYTVQGEDIISHDFNVSPAYITDELFFDFPSEGNAFEIQNLAAEKWFGIDELFEDVTPQYLETVNSDENERYKWVFGNENTVVERYNITTEPGDIVYLLSDTADYYYAINEDNRSAWNSACRSGVYLLCENADAGISEVYIAHDSSAETIDPKIAVIRSAKALKLNDVLTQRSGEYISKRGNTVKFMLKGKDLTSCTAVTSIPYEYGWNITVNGRKVDEPRVCGGLICLELNGGSNSVVMEYRPPCFRRSAIITVIMFAIGLYMSLYTEREISRRRKVRMAFRAVEKKLCAEDREVWEMNLRSMMEMQQNMSVEGSGDGVTVSEDKAFEPPIEQMTKSSEAEKCDDPDGCKGAQALDDYDEILSIMLPSELQDKADEQDL